MSECVSVSVGHTDVHCKTAEPNEMLLGSPRNHILDRSRIPHPHKRGAILGAVQLTVKHWASLLQQKIIQSSITTQHWDGLQHTTTMLNVTLLGLMRCFIKILWSLANDTSELWHCWLVLRHNEAKTSNLSASGLISSDCWSFADVLVITTSMRMFHRLHTQTHIHSHTTAAAAAMTSTVYSYFTDTVTVRHYIFCHYNLPSLPQITAQLHAQGQRHMCVNIQYFSGRHLIILTTMSNVIY